MTEIKQEPLDPDPEYPEQIPDQDEIHEVLEVKDTIDIKLEPVEQVINVVQFDDIEKDKEINNKKEKEVLEIKDTLDFKLEPVIHSDSEHSEHLELSENEDEPEEESEKVNNKNDSDEDFVMSESTNEDDESEEIEVDDIEDDVVKERDIFLFDIIFIWDHS